MDHPGHFIEPAALLPELFRTACLALMAGAMIVQPVEATGARASKSTQSALNEQRRWKEPLSPDEEIAQLLSRITFGARPGDFERVRTMGVKTFLDEQLHPENIDDAAVEARVASLPTLAMSPEELYENYPPPKQATNSRAQQAKTQPPQSAKSPGGEMTSKSQPGPQIANLQGPQRVISELAQEEVLRAVYSNRQLQELMVQFWMNHFNIFALKGADRWLTTSFERDTIRPDAMGKFEDLLVATAESPAMLFYLDNWLSSTPNPAKQGQFARPRPRNMNATLRPIGHPGYWPPRNLPGTASRPPRTRPAQGQQNRNRRGVNENYAREVMELHTLGVQGGYTQKDVIEVARCLTGWTIDRPRKGGEFIFRPRMHDFGEKFVLGKKIRAGRGMEDGVQVLHMLAHHPATAQFISVKLCRRFVADDPPLALIDRAAKTFLRTDGDIRQVLQTILTSPEFNSQAAYRAKVKSPLELVASSIRGIGGETDAGLPLLRMIARMGQPMFQYQAPTGFPDRASTWINSGSLLTRINFATLLAGNRIPGTQVDLEGLVPPSAAAQTVFVVTLATRLVGGELTPPTRDAIMASLGPEAGQVAGETPPARQWATAAGLLLASPEFQRR